MILRCRLARSSFSGTHVLIRQHSRSSSSLSRSKTVSHKLPAFPARTRFAPSPTGHLHLGSLRTALFNYLLARATNGQFVLRIEDTDQARTVPGAEDRLCADLGWAGLAWDEGPHVGGPYGPYRQSERKQIYQTHAAELLESGKAYRCFCSASELAIRAEERSILGLPTNYARTCADVPANVAEARAAAGEAHTIRFRSPRHYPRYFDLVYGQVGSAKGSKAVPLKDAQLEDFVLLKSDGMPTYHLANVVDDHLMSITHVVRATEWMPSTPKHLAIYEAFGWSPPSFAHVGLLVDSNGQKLSKRDASAGLAELIEDGIFPEALTNYLALQGWSHRRKSDYLPMAELIESFDLKFTKGNVIFDIQKLKYLQQMHLRNYIAIGGERFQQLVQSSCDTIFNCIDSEDVFVPSGHTLESYVGAILRADASNACEPRDFYSRHANFLTTKITRPQPTANEAGWLATFAGKSGEELSKIAETDWSSPSIKAAVDGFAVELASSLSPANATEVNLTSTERSKPKPQARISHALRWAIMGGKAGPPMVATMEILGQACTLERLRRAQSDVTVA